MFLTYDGQKYTKRLGWGMLRSNWLKSIVNMYSKDLILSCFEIASDPKSLSDIFKFSLRKILRSWTENS